MNLPSYLYFRNHCKHKKSITVYDSGCVGTLEINRFDKERSYSLCNSLLTATMNVSTSSRSSSSVKFAPVISDTSIKWSRNDFLLLFESIYSKNNVKSNIITILQNKDFTFFVEWL